MKARVAQDLDRIAFAVGATGWTLVRASKHLIVDWQFADATVRQVMSATASDQRARRNVEAEIRKALRAA